MREVMRAMGPAAGLALLVALLASGVAQAQDSLRRGPPAPGGSRIDQLERATQFLRAALERAEARLKEAREAAGQARRGVEAARLSGPRPSAEAARRPSPRDRAEAAKKDDKEDAHRGRPEDRRGDRRPEAQAPRGRDDERRGPPSPSDWWRSRGRPEPSAAAPRTRIEIQRRWSATRDGQQRSGQWSWSWPPRPSAERGPGGRPSFGRPPAFPPRGPMAQRPGEGRSPWDELTRRFAERRGPEPSRAEDRDRRGPEPARARAPERRPEPSRAAPPSRGPAPTRGPAPAPDRLGSIEQKLDRLVEAIDGLRRELRGSRGR